MAAFPVSAEKEKKREKKGGFLLWLFSALCSQYVILAVITAALSISIARLTDIFQRAGGSRSRPEVHRTASRDSAKPGGAIPAEAGRADAKSAADTPASRTGDIARPAAPGRAGAGSNQAAVDELMTLIDTCLSELPEDDEGDSPAGEL